LFIYLFIALSTFPVNENKAWEFNSSRILREKKTDESIEERIILGKKEKESDASGKTIKGRESSQATRSCNNVIGA